MTRYIKVWGVALGGVLALFVVSGVATSQAASECPGGATPRLSREHFRSIVDHFVELQQLASMSPVHSSSLEPDGGIALQDAFYDAGAAYCLDPRVLIAIAMQETILGRVTMDSTACANASIRNIMAYLPNGSCTTSAYPEWKGSVEDAAWDLKTKYVGGSGLSQQDFNLFDFILSGHRNYCTVDCKNCPKANDANCPTGRDELTKDVVALCSDAANSCNNCPPNGTDSGCDPQCRCWAGNTAHYLQEIEGGDPCNVWFYEEIGRSTARGCAGAPPPAGQPPPPPPSSCDIVVQQSARFPDTQGGTCSAQTRAISVRNPEECKKVTVEATLGANSAFTVILGSSFSLVGGEEKLVVLGFCPNAVGNYSETLTLTVSGVTVATPSLLGRATGDLDGDGYCSGAGPCPLCGAGDCPNGFNDCDDHNAAIHPGATEGPPGDASCQDGRDNNCDGGRDCQDTICRADVRCPTCRQRCSTDADCHEAGTQCTFSCLITPSGTGECANHCIPQECGDVCFPAGGICTYSSQCQFDSCCCAPPPCSSCDTNNPPFPRCSNVFCAGATTALSGARQTAQDAAAPPP